MRENEYSLMLITQQTNTTLAMIQILRMEKHVSERS